MKNTKLTQTLARMIFGIILLTGMAMAATEEIRFNVIGDQSQVSITLTPDPGSSGGGTKSTTTSAVFSNLSGSWYGKISIKGSQGFKVSPEDTVIVGLKQNLTINVVCTDTSKPIIKISHLNNISIDVGQIYTFVDSIQDNSSKVSSIRHEFSIDSGKTWDSLNYQKWEIPNYLSVNVNIFSSHPQSFTPTIASENFMLRAIVTDYFHQLADTAVASFKVNLKVNTKTPAPVKKMTLQSRNISTFDLLGKKVKQNNCSKYYISKINKILFIR